ncbi:hypothetical protein D3C81_1086150 [compost metagenome]
MSGLGAEGTDALLHAQVYVGESVADPSAMVDAKLCFAQTVATVFQSAFFDVVVRAQVGQAGIERSLRKAVAVDHPLCAQLVVLGIAGLLELEVVGLRLRPVSTLTIGIVEVPPAPRQVVIEHLVVGGVLVIADCIVAAAQYQLVSQAQWAVPFQAIAPLLLAGRTLALIITRQIGAPGLCRGVAHFNGTTADAIAGNQLHLRLVGRQSIELVDHLLDVSQVEPFADYAGKRHRQLPR